MSEALKIVIADDHPLFREGVAHSLCEDPELNVIAQSGSGEEAVELAGRLQPDLVMLDLHMPGIGGLEAARRISAATPGMRIVMLTVSEEPDNLFAALKAGAHGYVLKGVSASELRAVTRSVGAGNAYVTPSLATEMLIEFSRPCPKTGVSELTARELEVLKLLGEGLTNREIGERMFLAEKTVKHYMTIVLNKLQVRSRTEAALIAVRHDSYSKNLRTPGSH